jgi:D-alanine transaminase/branched-chain amino acid aminotransferase
MRHFCYLNGELFPADEAQIHLNDIGLLRGYGLFDYCRTYHGTPFMPDLYLSRFFCSATQMQMEVPLAKPQIKDIMDELLRLSGFPDVAFRLLLTGGYTPDGITPGQPNLAIMTENVAQVDESKFTQGIKVITHEYLRDMPEVKSTNYIRLILLAKEIQAQKAADVLYHSHGEVSELSRSNLFFFKGDTLVTPHQNVLKGITRRLVLEIALDNFKIEQRTVTLPELLAADEVFTTGTTKKVMPIVQIDGHTVGRGKPGDRTRFLLDLFNKLAMRETRQAVPLSRA